MLSFETSLFLFCVTKLKITFSGGWLAFRNIGQVEFIWKRLSNLYTLTKTLLFVPIALKVSRFWFYQLVCNIINMGFCWNIIIDDLV